eukprot:gnl/TRDRNA2_/TRDRNA2_105500_c0_seq1.p1 gnl/TRDRNA2_/TRDRNA2_105500_c0~~gnl/TRDRNA2_/TRDRNA2_105500_c0_seq1.p1  ORF type:complete len:307 (-),score=36.19 gnl/TRDRNA2_/TRDRNA2_105500_c0_seq1:112-1032(-)
MTTVNFDSYRVKDATEWSAYDVQEFLQEILPRHPCLDFFTYTSGYVLCSLNKDDIRRQAKDEEAANIIWSELRGYRRAAKPQTAFKERSGVSGSPTITVFVRKSKDVAVECEVLPNDSVATLKAKIFETDGTRVECQRLIFSGLNMQDDRTLASYGVRQGSLILLIPQIREQGTARGPKLSAPRGLLMVPGCKAWEPSPPVRPYLPVICSDVSRNFPVSLEFDSAEDYDALISAAQEEPPVIEIIPSRRGQLPVETRLYLDPDIEGVRLDSASNILVPGSSYEAVVHFGGRGGEVKVTVATGQATS